MKTKLEVNLVEVSVLLPGAFACDLTRLAGKIRARKNPPRTKYGRVWRKQGIPVPLESWRELTARYLRRLLPKGYWVYVGGHHVAVMLPEGGESAHSFAVAKFVEVTPV